VEAVEEAEDKTVVDTYKEDTQDRAGNKAAQDRAQEEEEGIVVVKTGAAVYPSYYRCLVMESPRRSD
jgi:hypothetical protein